VRYLLVALLALGFVVSGCGDDDKTKDEKATTQAAPATDDKATHDSSTGVPHDVKAKDEKATEDAATGVPSSPQAKQGVESCRKQARADRQLSANATTKIGELCEDAVSGDPDRVGKAAREGCEIAVKAKAPPGSARQRLLAACKQPLTSPELCEIKARAKAPPGSARQRLLAACKQPTLTPERCESKVRAMAPPRSARQRLLDACKQPMSTHRRCEIIVRAMARGRAAPPAGLRQRLLDSCKQMLMDTP